jgi:hypothetical protein
MDDIEGLDIALSYVRRLSAYDMTTNGNPKTWYKRITNTEDKRIWINKGTPSLKLYFVDEGSDFDKIIEDIESNEIMSMVVYEEPVKGIEKRLNGSKAIAIGFDRNNYGLPFEEFMQHFYDKLLEK